MTAVVIRRNSPGSPRMRRVHPGEAGTSHPFHLPAQQHFSSWTAEKTSKVELLQPIKTPLLPFVTERLD